MGTVYANSTFVICCKVSWQLSALKEDGGRPAGATHQTGREKEFPDGFARGLFADLAHVLGSFVEFPIEWEGSFSCSIWG